MQDVSVCKTLFSFASSSLVASGSHTYMLRHSCLLCMSSSWNSYSFDLSLSCFSNEKLRTCPHATGWGYNIPNWTVFTKGSEVDPSVDDQYGVMQPNSHGCTFLSIMKKVICAQLESDVSTNLSSRQKWRTASWRSKVSEDCSPSVASISQPILAWPGPNHGRSRN